MLPELPRARGAAQERRDREGRAAEAIGLAQAIGLEVQGDLTFTVRRIYPGTLIGPGQLASAKDAITDAKVELTIVDAALSPVQQKNLESAWQCKVIDRTALILEIFGERAATAEGRLQVELAHLDYQVGRLVRSWTHLERQRGGFGFLGGPGETQIEADRRLIRDRMARLRRQLEDVRRTRALHRHRRKKAPWPIVALVGYTNAGKSTLFNSLTGSAVMAENQLFATLDPTMRRLSLAGVGTVILSDTVGFVSDLPTQLIAAFRATLEEVESADLLLHVRDVSHPDTEAQRADVLDILLSLGIGEGEGPPLIEVHNKIDQFHNDDRNAAIARAEREGALAISAVQGWGMEHLIDRLRTELSGDAIERRIILPIDDGARQSWLHRHARILDSAQSDSAITYDVRLTKADSARFDQLPRMQS